jgi:hypothetical protein
LTISLSRTSPLLFFGQFDKFAHRSEVQVLSTRPPPPSCTAAPDLELAFPRSIRQCRNLHLKKLSTPSPSALPFSSPSSSGPRYNNCFHLSRRTSPFRKLQHKTSSYSPQLLQRSLFLPTKTSRKREKAMLSSAVSTHTLTHADNTSALPMSIRPLRTNPSAPLFVYLTSCCIEKKGERRR